MFCLYILQGKNGKYYVGSTSNLKRRMSHHISGLTPSTKKFGKLELVFSQEFDTLAEARKVERRLKRMKRRDYLEKIIAEGIIRMAV